MNHKNQNKNIVSVIDIGSNSVKMRIGTLDDFQNLVIIHDETEVTKLGRYILNENGEKIISHESMELSLKAIKKMSEISRKFGVPDENTFLVGTMALRAAKNSQNFLNLVESQTALKIKILSGNDEAMYSCIGSLQNLKNISRNFVLFDTGGGSTEFISGQFENNNITKITNVLSVPLGAVNLTEKFLFRFNKSELLSPKNIKTALSVTSDYINEIFSEHDVKNLFFPDDKNNNVSIIGVGGGLVAMACVKKHSFVPSNVHGEFLYEKDVLRQLKLYSSLNLNERQNILGLPENRADVILASSVIINEIIKLFPNSQKKSIIVSINGLRNGLLFEKLKILHNPEMKYNAVRVDV